MGWLDGFENYLSAWTLGSVFLRLALACVVGVVIGLNREMLSKGAGVKTHVLVCMGSALAMMVSQYVYVHFPEATADMNRMGAGVVSGVGFLGVGTIMVTGRNEVRGLTTAAGLWATACIGLAVGIGAAVVSVMALAFVLFTFIVLTRLDVLIHERSRNFDIVVELASLRNVKTYMQWLEDRDVAVAGFRFNDTAADPESVSISMSVTLGRGYSKAKFVDDVNNLRYVDFCNET